MLSTQYALTLDGLALCAMCRGRLVSDPNTEETVCSSCGIVYEVPSICPPFSSGPPSFGAETDPPVNESSMKYDLDLPTLIGPESVDARGRMIAGRYDWNRLRRLNNITLQKDSEKKSLTQAIDTIRRVSEKIHAGSTVAERAYRIYCKYNGDGYTRRKAIANAAMASVYLACKELGIARSSLEIEKAIRDMNPRGIRYYSKSIKNQLGIGDNTPEASSFVGRIAARAGLSGKTERRAIEILLSVKGSLVLAGKRPVPLAASALYLASRLTGEYITLSRIACVAEVTPITVRKRSAEISEILVGAKSCNPNVDQKVGS